MKKNEIEVEFTLRLSDDDSETDRPRFIVTYTHKMTSTHGSQESRCTFHDTTEKHKQTYGYYKCTSSKCFRSPEDSCTLQFRENKCSLDLVSRLYQVGDHSNKYENETENKRPGISMFF